jgi:hypothetical protein
MPSARELLEQADALMRKNRTRGDGDIPLLTEAVALVPISLAVPMSAPPLAAVAPPADVPVLTDAVTMEEDVVAVVDFEPPPEPRSAPPAALVAIMEGDPSDWLVMDTIDPASHSITGRAPDTLAVVPPMTLKAAGSEPTPPPLGSQPRAEASQTRAAPAEPDWLSLPVSVDYPVADAPPANTEVAALERALPASAHGALEPEPAETVLEPVEREAVAAAHAPVARAAVDEEHWRTLAEQVSMQVLQRLDLFTDSGLREQLAQRLEPIVERASAELVGELTEHVGRLVRTYVSEAIEREIAQWKREQQ